MRANPKVLAALHARVFTVPRPFSAKEIAELLETPGALLCQDAHGFALGRAIAGQADLFTLAVAPEFRRRGVARRLMQSFHAGAIAQDADAAFLEVDAENGAALGLYRGFGYQEVLRRRAYYRHPDGHATDAILMRRALSDDDRLQVEDRQ